MSGDEFNPNSMDAVLARMEEKLDKALNKLDKHDEDISSLKQWRGYLIGIATAIGVALNFLKDLFTSKPN